MFDSFFGLGNLLGLYSGSPLLAAVGSFSRPEFYGGARHGGEFINMGPLLGFILPFFFMILFVLLAVCILMVVSHWKLFEKAGRPGWAAIVPVYNVVVMLQIVEMSPWLALAMFIPGVGSIALFIVSIFLNIRLAKLFNKDEGFAVGLILIPVIFVPILAFGQAVFSGKKPVVTPNPFQNPPVSPTASAMPTAPANPVPQTNIADQTKPTDIV